MLKPISELRVRITGSTDIPEPTKVQSTGDWYFLDHISSGLAYYDSSKKTFLPMLAENWSEQADGTHAFRLRDGIKFHDGTPITAKDVLWSIKRHLIKKTSTHFPLWDYLVGCDKLTQLDQDCDGLYVRNGNEIIFRLKAQTDSFFLQLASPETGIWSANDMNVETAELTLKKFSGPYFVDSRDESYALLKRNENSMISTMFPESPRAIRIKRVPLTKLDQALMDREIDLAIKMHSPLAEPDWEKNGIGAQATTPSYILYFYGLGAGDQPPIGRDFIEALWRDRADTVLSSSETFLPFSPKNGLTKSEFLESLPAKTGAKLRVMCPEGFFSQNFLEQIQASAKSVGTEIEFTPVGQAEFMGAFDDPKAYEKFDYILSAYAASERYTAVQLRYLTKARPKPAIDLKRAESPDFTGDRVAIFKEYERWLLKSRVATPIYFNVMLFVHQAGIDLGEQSKNDAEIELWRVRERVK